MKKFERDRFRCAYCGFDGSTFERWAFLQIDHCKPQCLGGDHEPTNLKTSYIVCNHMKGGKPYNTVEEARAEIQQWWSQMRTYWDTDVKHRVSPS
ncbi:MAG: HNH endonuclease, partial [Nitrospiraceae bacterium]